MSNLKYTLGLLVCRLCGNVNDCSWLVCTMRAILLPFVIIFMKDSTLEPIEGENNNAILQQLFNTSMVGAHFTAEKHQGLKKSQGVVNSITDVELNGKVSKIMIFSQGQMYNISNVISIQVILAFFFYCAPLSFK